MEVEALIPEDGTDAEKRLKYTMAVCASMHLCFVLPPGTADEACLPCELNPSCLLCTCKGFRSFLQLLALLARHCVYCLVHSRDL